MAKKVFLQDENKIEILPITRGELVLDSSGNPAFSSNEFLATTSQPGLMSKEDKIKINSLSTYTLEISNLLLSGKKIATLDVGGTSYNILAPATYAWSEITDRPTKLSQFTDDVVAGKYLPLTGGTISTNIATNTPLIIQSLYDGVGWVGIAYKNKDGNLGGLGINKDGTPLFVTSDKVNAYTILHAGNYSQYALPLTGNAASATKLAKAVYLWGNEFDGTRSLSKHLYLDAGSYISWVIGNTKVNNLVTGSTGNFLVGNGGALLGYKTYLDGGTLHFRTAKEGVITTAMTITEDGDVLIGNPVTVNSAKFLINGGMAHIHGLSSLTSLGEVLDSGLTIGSAAYGISQWVTGSGQGNIQVGRFDGTATAYALNLNPLGGEVNVGEGGLNVNSRIVSTGSLSLGTEEVAGAIYLRRKTHNYLWASSEGGSISMGVQSIGGAGVANASLQILPYSLNPGTRNNEVSLGTPSFRWSNVYSVNGNFLGTITGNLDGTYVNKLTGYTKATAISALAATDTLNTALGKLEYKADVAYNLVKGAYDGDGTIENLEEILRVLEGISDTDTIQAIVGKYLPLSGGELTGSISYSFVTSGGDATGWWYKNNGTRVAGIGALGESGTLQHIFLGWGTSPWLESNSLAVSDTKLKYKGFDIIHAGNWNQFTVSKDNLMTYVNNNTDYVAANLPTEISKVAVSKYIEYWDGSTGGNGWFNSKWGTITAVNGFVGNVTGNASSSTKLQTARTIWGQYFDGTGDVSGNLTIDKAIGAYLSDRWTDANGDTHPWYGLDFTHRVKGVTLSSYYGLTFKVGGGAMFINSAGNVTIGGSDLALTNHRLYVSGTAYVANVSYLTNVEIRHITDKNYIASLYMSTKGFHIQSRHEGVAYINTILNQSGGNVLIGTTDDNGNKLQVNGQVFASGFVKSGSSDSYLLLGGGGQKAISDFLLKSEVANQELNNNLTTITKSLTVTSDWMDTGISSTNIPATGTYIVQVSVHNSTDNVWYGYWSGVMSWYIATTNDTDTDEIILHRAGHAYGNTIYLRTVMQSNSVLKLQIAANKTLSTAATYTFKFKRVI